MVLELIFQLQITFLIIKIELQVSKNPNCDDIL